MSEAPAWYTAEITSSAIPEALHCGGTAPVVAAWLRAVADQIDPKRPVLRGAVDVSDAELARWRQIKNDGGPR